MRLTQRVATVAAGLSSVASWLTACALNNDGNQYWWCFGLAALALAVIATLTSRGFEPCD